MFGCTTEKDNQSSKHRKWLQVQQVRSGPDIPNITHSKPSYLVDQHHFWSC